MTLRDLIAKTRLKNQINEPNEDELSCLLDFIKQVK